MPTSFQQFFTECQQRTNRFLSENLPPAIEPAAKLKAAMRYSCLDGGKRVRATLVYATANIFTPAFTSPLIDTAAAAVECIHAYSLIHDDLPAMDNDDLRRGKPTCHRAYDEATAILAGDALQTFAFELLSKACSTDSARLLSIIRHLAAASGSGGMAGGQAMDMDATGQNIDLAVLESVHRHKTGALITASVMMGALAGGASDEEVVFEKLKDYAKSIGLAFQVQDDILDVQSSTEILGKTSGSDISMAKATYVSLLGINGAGNKVSELHQNALSALSGFGGEAEHLRQLAKFIIERKH
ncbi:MAG: polyprenyl synthetase family protein [Pseudomonadales bacterium]|nr:polyprenyl synthetase family protein [Pseudomonadales bacterium]